MISQSLLEKLLPKWSPTLFKVSIGAAMFLAVALPLAMVPIPMIEFFNGMAAQPKAKAQGTYGRVFGAELLVERLPVEGTMPRGYFPYEFESLGNELVDAKKVGETLMNPVPMSKENLLRGQEVYSVYCTVCHGKTGIGDGPVIGPDRFPAPPSMHTDQTRDYSDGTIFHIITKGTGKMPAYAGQVDADDRWKAIHYLRALQRAQHPEPGDIKE
jgi:mono/diheme cytochrome c family protein